MDAFLDSLALNIYEGQLTLPGGTSLHAAVIAFLEKLTTAQPFDPALCDFLDGSLFDKYMSGPLTIRGEQDIISRWMAPKHPKHSTW